MPNAIRILFVDDEQTFLDSTADLLRREGYPCDIAATVSAAQELLQQNSYDLFIADIKMPGNCDLEFVRQLATSAGGIAVILVTGYPSVASAVQSVELPVVAYLVKPFDFQELLSRVRATAESVGVQRILRGELERLQAYRQDLGDVEARMREQPRVATSQPLEALVAMTLRNVVDGLTMLRGVVENADRDKSGDPAIGRSGKTISRDMREALNDTVATLERTKGAFKSKELGELRKRLESLLKTHHHAPA